MGAQQDQILRTLDWEFSTSVTTIHRTLVKSTETFKTVHPVAPYSSADPQVMKHTDGYYYFVHTLRAGI